MVSRLVLRYLLVGGYWGFALGVATAAAATLVQLAFRDFFLQLPFLLFFPATLLASFFGGWRAGLACIAVSAVAAAVFFVGRPAAFLLGGPEMLRIAIFVLIALLMVGFIALLQGVSAQLQAEHDRVRLMFREMNHRVANSLQLVAATIQLQAGTAATPELRDGLRAALARVLAVGRVHRRLVNEPNGPALALAPYLADTCRDVAAQVASGAACRVDCDDIGVARELALKLGMIVNELVVNAFKHGAAQPDVAVECRARDGGFSLEVSGAGPELPEGFDAANSKGVGMRIVDALTTDIGGRLALHRAGGRTVVEVVVPRSEAAVAA
jgi:two-component sensor histidine kinase